jgi:hypothetical protein
VLSEKIMLYSTFTIREQNTCTSEEKRFEYIKGETIQLPNQIENTGNRRFNNQNTNKKWE